MDLSISNSCPICGKVAGAQKAVTPKPTASESYGDKATFGLDENIASALCYLLGWLTGIIFLLVEQNNKVVRFHAMQSILTFLFLGILGFIISMMTIGSGYSYAYSFGMWALVGTLISVVQIILWLVLMIKAYQGELFMVPIVGNIAAHQLD